MHTDAESHSSKTKLNVLWDGGATLSLIIFRKFEPIKFGRGGSETYGC